VLKETNQRSYDQRERHHHEKIEKALTGQQQSCHQTFKISSYREQKNINPIRAEGTCQWALRSPEYTRWSESNCNDLLWISADPGCGKSVLARSIIDDYMQAGSPARTICYFFFKDNDEQNHLTAALCSVLHQLFSERPHLVQYAVPSWEKNGERLRQETDDLWGIFVKAASADVDHKTICVFDALDECRDIDQDRLIEKLHLFHRQPSSSQQDASLKFLVTSRPYDHIQSRFRAITSSFSHLHLKGEEENDQIHEEIDHVVKMRVRELAETAPLSQDIQQRLEQSLLQMEHRTYLWLHLAIDDIQYTFENSLRPAEESIRLIPPSVNKAYERILSRVPPDQVNTVRIVLRIIVGARRPLTTAEMAMALGIALCPQSRTAAQAGLDPLQMETKLRRLCGLFVFINNSKIFLIHQTAREFLIGQESMSNPNFAYSCSLVDIEGQMANICLQYLLMEDLEGDGDESCSNTQSLLEYSAVHWPDHVREMNLTSDKEATNRLHQVYDTSGNQFSQWFPIFWKEVMPYQGTPEMKALHLAAYNGHEQVVQFLLASETRDINQADNTSTYPIMWAAVNGHDKVVQILLERGADVSAQGGQFGTALQAACSRGHDEIVQILLERGADVSAQGGHFGNAIQAACVRGHHDIVQMLLERGADVRAQSGYYRNALRAACSRGYDKIVQILLEQGADISTQGGHYGNALKAACYGGHDSIVQMLLERGANSSTQGRDYGNALQTACSRGYDSIVQMLLERGADVSAQGEGQFGNALQAACSEGHDKIVQMLLERGADISAQGADYGNALQAACARGHDETVQMLLERGADIRAQDGQFGNTLQAACYGGRDKIVQILLERGADVSAQGGQFGNAFQAACYGGHDKVVQILLERGANVSAQGGRFGNALHAARARGHDNVVQIPEGHQNDLALQSTSYLSPSKRLMI
jgi:ankyrin repeat protein